MKRRLILFLGALALGVVGTAGVLYWQEALEIWQLSRFESRDADAATRNAIAETLVGWRSLRAVPVFLKAESSQLDHPFEPHAERILKTLTDDEHERLAALVRTEEESLQLRLVRLASRSGVAPVRLLPYLRRALRSPNAGFRRWACEEIGEIGPPAARLAADLETARGDGDRFVRLWARIALARLAPEAAAAVDLLKADAGG